MLLAMVQVELQIGQVDFQHFVEAVDAQAIVATGVCLKTSHVAIDYNSLRESDTEG